MQSAPILIVAFNQPKRLARLLTSLKEVSPTSLRISIDGPRGVADQPATDACRDLAEEIDWIEDLEVWYRTENLGISRGIPAAVNRVFEQFDRVLVLEDDVTVGPQALPFVTHCLSEFENNPHIFSISAYNSVPEDVLSSPEDPVRTSRVMSSYAWGTWKDRWQKFDSNMTWFRNQKTKYLSNVLGSREAAIRWRQHCRYVRKNLVDCAAYRWNMSTWEFDGYSIVPNQNLVEYHGMDDGTHTRRHRRWSELPVGQIDLSQILDCSAEELVDWRAESFFHRKAQRASWGNILLGPLEEGALRLQQRGWI